jgi:low affinity Fe/Cu permease
MECGGFLMYHHAFFGRFANVAARAMGHPLAFVLAVLIIVGWALTGPSFGFSDTWQLVINTGTTIVTFLMVFLIQNTQNRESAAIQLKLDELIRTQPGAHNALLDLEELGDDELERLRAVYEELARQAREQSQRGVLDTDTPEVQATSLQLLAREMRGAGERPPWSSLIRPGTPSGPPRWPPSREKPAHDPPCGHRDGNPQCGGGPELDGEILWPSGSRSPSALMSVLAVQYAQNWDAHRQHSQPYVGRGVR